MLTPDPSNLNERKSNVLSNNIFEVFFFVYIFKIKQYIFIKLDSTKQIISKSLIDNSQ